MIPDYSKGKIYVLRSYKSEDIYIGSTCSSTLSLRMAQHRSNYKRWLQGKSNYTTSFEIIKYEDAYIELLLDCPCDRKEQLLMIEGKYIREVECVNHNIAGRKISEWKQENLEYTKNYNKQYYQKNIDYHRNYYIKNCKKMINCECGSSVAQQNLCKHLKTKKHLRLMKQLNQNEEIINIL
jgi:hypothetical protein